MSHQGRRIHKAWETDIEPTTLNGKTKHLKSETHMGEERASDLPETKL